MSISYDNMALRLQEFERNAAKYHRLQAADREAHHYASARHNQDMAATYCRDIALLRAALIGGPYGC